MYFSYGPEISYQVLNGSGVVGDSGKPQALYAASVKSGGGGAGNATFMDGTTASGIAVFDINGTTSKTVKDNASIGQVFPKGLFVSFDANVSSVTVWSRQIIT